MSVKIEEVGVRTFNATVNVPIYRQCKIDLDHYLEGVKNSRNATTKKGTIDDIKEFFDAEKVAESKVYKDANGYYFPTRQFKSAMIEAAKKFKDPQRGQTATQRIKAGIKIAVDKIPLGKDKYEIYACLVKSAGRQGGMIPTAWPEFHDVTLTIPIQLLDEFISMEFLRNICQVAITMFGIGAGRPECGTGTFVDLVKLD